MLPSSLLLLPLLLLLLLLLLQALCKVWAYSAASPRQHHH
jgi:hypothetical protein